MSISPVQRIVMFQERGSGEEKVRAVRERGRSLAIVRVVDIDDLLPPVLDAPEVLLPETLEADLVLDHLIHPDLGHALALLCRRLGIPVVAPGRRIPVPGLVSPPTCCGLAEAASLGPYGEQFGLPAYEARLDPDGRLAWLRVGRGAPCGASWDAIPRLLGLEASEAITRVGLEVQLVCKARPAAWDPLSGQSPLHFAGRVHARALERALGGAGLPGDALGPGSRP